jgi:hypothetical protein
MGNQITNSQGLLPDDGITRREIIADYILVRRFHSRGLGEARLRWVEASASHLSVNYSLLQFYVW